MEDASGLYNKKREKWEKTERWWWEQADICTHVQTSAMVSALLSLSLSLCACVKGRELYHHYKRPVYSCCHYNSVSLTALAAHLSVCVRDSNGELLVSRLIMVLLLQSLIFFTALTQLPTHTHTHYFRHLVPLTKTAWLLKILLKRGTDWSHLHSLLVWRWFWKFNE